VRIILYSINAKGLIKNTRMKNELNILIVEDNKGDERIIRELLGEQNRIRFNIAIALSLKESAVKINKNDFDIILLDLGLPDSSGLDTLTKLMDLSPKLTTIIILTGLNDTEVGLKALNNGAQDYIIKGQFDSERLLKSIIYSFERSRMNIELKTQIEARKIAEKEILTLNSDLEQRIYDRTAQLEIVNLELEAFSHSVSHDLRAPLRHINGFAEILKEEFYDQIPEKAKNYLNTISDSAKKMNILIDDLLNLSRINRIELKKTKLKMNQVIDDALNEVRPFINNRKVTFDISPLPEVNGDYNLLRLVWVNLLDNAIKYTRTKKNAVIKITYKLEKKEFIFCISDNGVGFDMTYSQKLFGVFQRLHSEEEFEGTGIGLSNVRRIISRHSGRTWAEAKINKGAAFYFSLPKE
jgi:signal transduction histidine kinase